MSKTLQGKYAEKLEKENKKLKDKINKAIEYNKENKKFANEVENRYAEEICKNNLEILGDKEIKEIPQFKGTLEQLDSLTIRGDDNDNN